MAYVTCQNKLIGGGGGGLGGVNVTKRGEGMGGKAFGAVRLSYSFKQKLILTTSMAINKGGSIKLEWTPMSRRQPLYVRF